MSSFHSGKRNDLRAAIVKCQRQLAHIERQCRSPSSTGGTQQRIPRQQSSSHYASARSPAWGHGRHGRTGSRGGPSWTSRSKDGNSWKPSGTRSTSNKSKTHTASGKWSPAHSETWKTASPGGAGMATTSSGRAGSPPSTSRRTWKNSKLTCERPDNGESASRYNSSLNGTPLARIPAGMESSSEEDWEKEDPEETARREARKQWLLKDTVKRSKSTQTELAWDDKRRIC